MKLVSYVLIHVTTCAKPRGLLMTNHYSHLSLRYMCSDSLALGKGGQRVPFESKGMLKPRPQGFFFIKWGTEKLASLLVLLKGPKSHILVFLKASIFLL